MSMQETRFEGIYLVNENGKNYIYDENQNSYHEASNLEMSFYETKKYGAKDYSIDNWMAW